MEITLPKVPTNLNTYDLIFEATVGNGIFGNIAIDDVFFASGGTCEYFNSTTTTQPTTTTLPSSFLECNFEKDLCEWNVDNALETKWVRRNGRLSQYGTAPLSDVTLQNSLGYYAYVNPSLGASSNKAILRSPVISNNKEACFEFWYQLGGTLNSGLTISVAELQSTMNRIELWTRKGNQADSWSHSYIRIPQNFTQYYIELEGEAFLSANLINGYVAVDEIKVLNGECPTSQFCDFESPNICNYQNDLTADFKWERFKGKTTSLSTGPINDHTYQTDQGYYMYIKSRLPQKKGFYL